MAASGVKAHLNETSGKLGLTNSDYTVGYILERLPPIQVGSQSIIYLRVVFPY